VIIKLGGKKKKKKWKNSIAPKNGTKSKKKKEFH